MSRAPRRAGAAWLLVLLTLVAATVAAETPGRPQSGLPGGQIRVDGIPLQVELARSPEQRRIGLMHREKLAEDAGMLFVFDAEQRLSFWMKNTLIPLDIAYIAADGRIVDIQSMAPLSQRGHPSRAPARFALEVNQGWFARHGVEVGDRVAIPVLFTTR